MEDTKDRKQALREEIILQLKALPPEELARKNQAIEERLFDFANFMEARIALLYVMSDVGLYMTGILKRSLENQKMVVLPEFRRDKNKINMLKIDNLEKDITRDEDNRPIPDKNRCKVVPLQVVDIAIVPGIGFDEKGGRLGRGLGNYDRLIPRLPNTTRKVALAFEEQIISQIPMESHDKHVDIIISEERVIYKI